ncbi:autolysin [Lentilactobacillus sp. G22-6]|uniref:GH25 family lysozyme n=1 Tax=Lentilactobacillus dabitei TaxID=2831523 RepID=UPI001C255D0C|nr:GH25 family lysozyme [Lentilactobacillus dabitei]MBU9788882.1 autolysin [Lentilactobacillus dabitei]
MPSKVIDISAYQGESTLYLHPFKTHGVKSVMVKLTEGTSYLNPKAGSQVTNAFKVFGLVGVYHFFHGYGEAEARYFLSYVHKFGLDKSTVLAIDVEAQDLPWSTTHQVNVFLKYLIDHGYKHVITYGSASWFNSGRIKRADLVDKHIWVAAYGTSQPGVANANSWQYTDDFHGVDCSLDFDGSLSGTKEDIIVKPVDYKTNGLYEVTADKLCAYRTKNKHLIKRRVVFVKGSRVYAKAVKTKHGYILKTAVGYISARTDYVKFLMKAGD